MHGRSNVSATAMEPVACIQDTRGVYFKHLSCLPGRSLAHYRRHRCLARCLFENSSCLFNGPSLAHYRRHRCLARLLGTIVAFLHLRSLPSTCDRSTAPAIVSLHLRSLPSTCNLSPPPTIAYPPPAIAPLHLRSLPSTCNRFPPPAMASLHL
jgi:hypothetical protein